MPAAAANTLAQMEDGPNLLVELIKMSSKHAAILETISESIKELKDVNMTQHGQVTERIGVLETKLEVVADRVTRLQEADKEREKEIASVEKTTLTLIAEIKEEHKRDIEEERKERVKNTLQIQRIIAVVGTVLAIGEGLAIIGPLLGWF